MTEQNHRFNPADDLDQAIDAALAKYSAVEPREGLEQRILTNLRAQSSTTSTRAWWRWGLVAVLALLLFAVGLAWNSRKASHSVKVQQQPTLVPAKDARTGEPSGLRTRAVPALKAPPVIAVIHRKRTRDLRTMRIASAPKRNQFPSPQPLSEQEKMLANYVAQYPEHAVLVARAQAEFEKQNEDEMREMNSGSKQDLKQIEQ